MEGSWLSNSLNRVFVRLNSVFVKIMAMMIIVTLIIFMFVPLILNELKEATTGIVIDTLSKEQEYIFEEIHKNTKESIFISAKPYLLKQENISTKEQIETWDELLLGIGNSLNVQYGLIRIMTFDLSGRIIHNYGINSNTPLFDPQQNVIKEIISKCLETESSSERVVTSLNSNPYWGLCLLSEDRDDEVSNAHLFILDYKKILTKMKITTNMDVAIQIGNSIIHDNLGKEYIDGIIKKEKIMWTTNSEENKLQKHGHQYIIAESELTDGHIFPINRESYSLIFFIHSDEIQNAFQTITSDLKKTTLLIAVLSSLFLLATIYYILRPMKGVTAVAQSISNGNYNVRLNHKSRDEIGTVMATIDNMLDKIQENYKTIKNEKENAEAAEKALEKSQSAIVHHEKMASVGQLAGGIAHDFNNILSVINGYSELVLNDMEEDSPFKEHIATINSAGEKAANLTKELLAFSRKQPIEMKASNINTTIDNMRNILKPLIGENIRFKINKHKGLMNVLADKTQLEQVLMNLVVNARDAMPNGGDLIIKTYNVYFRKGFDIDNEHIDPGSYTMLLVKDTGKGMSNEVRKSIFEPFFSTKDIGKGTGMGLATVYGIIRQHGGNIIVHSKSGGGTIFKIYIPATDKEIEEDTAISVNDLKGNETILVVDDEPLLIGLVVEMLEPLGYHILVASNGEEALKVCNAFTGRIDLLVTDVIMPGMNGKELADKFIVKRPETKIIYMSGYTDDLIAHHGVLDVGVVLINKPIKSNVIASKIREVLGSKIHLSDNKSVEEKLNGSNILIADDNTSIRKLIQTYMKDYKCTIDTAENGEIAVEKFKLAKYDFVLMDMQMPVMDGLTATSHIRQWEKENRPSVSTIIALTGSVEKEIINKCIHAGCSYHLAKPIKKDVLIKSLALNIATVEKDVSVNQENQDSRFVVHIASELKELVPEYLDEIQSDINKIQEAISAQDCETVKIVGHTLKGSGGGYGFDPISEMGIHIEVAAKEEDYEGIEHWNNKLSDYISNVDIIYG